MDKSSASPNRDNTICIFDVDGTIAHHGQIVQEDMKHFLQQVRSHVSVGVIGGSPLYQFYTKLGKNGLQCHGVI